METRRKRRIAFGIPTASVLFVSVFLFRFFKISADRIILFPLEFFNIFLNLSQNQAFSQVLISLPKSLMKFLLPLVPFAITFGLLALYGKKYGEDKVFAVISVLPAVITGCIISNFSYPSIFFFGGTAVVSLLITGFGETYEEELDKWSNFRVGSSSFGKVFLILILFLLIGLFVHTSLNVQSYKEKYINKTGEIATGFISPEGMGFSEMSDEELIQQLPESRQKQIESLPKEQREKVVSTMRNEMESQFENASSNVQSQLRDRFLESDKFSSLTDLIIFSSVLGVMGVLLFLKKIFYGPIAGIVTLLGSLF